MRAMALAPAAAAMLLLAACQPGLDEARPLPVLDEAYFRCRVQPVLAKTCAALLCHGDPRRYFRVYARNRLRISPVESERNALFTPEERAANLAAARAFAAPADPARSLLLLKPLDERGGGYFHGGATLFGKGDVFLATDDPDYQVLAQWIGGATDDPACVEAGSNL